MFYSLIMCYAPTHWFTPVSWCLNLSRPAGQHLSYETCPAAINIDRTVATWSFFEHENFWNQRPHSRLTRWRHQHFRHLRDVARFYNERPDPYGIVWPAHYCLFKYEALWLGWFCAEWWVSWSDSWQCLDKLTVNILWLNSEQIRQMAENTRTTKEQVQFQRKNFNVHLLWISYFTFLYNMH